MGLLRGAVRPGFTALSADTVGTGDAERRDMRLYGVNRYCSTCLRTRKFYEVEGGEKCGFCQKKLVLRSKSRN